MRPFVRGNRSILAQDCLPRTVKPYFSKIAVASGERRNVKYFAASALPSIVCPGG
jgi:hypothetical protein